ncbi:MULTISPECIES: hypothetical protein [unclassified Peribacillus]
MKEKEPSCMMHECQRPLTKINKVTENTLVVGMDIAKRVHYACFVDG